MKWTFMSMIPFIQELPLPKIARSYETMDFLLVDIFLSVISLQIFWIFRNCEFKVGSYLNTYSSILHNDFTFPNHIVRNDFFGIVNQKPSSIQSLSIITPDLYKKDATDFYWFDRFDWNLNLGLNWRFCRFWQFWDWPIRIILRVGEGLLIS